ncbi:cytochrome c oxidase assembly factor CtaG [Niallia endozanthoxylica]|uniref:Cytochrome c oxidase assembly factor CtaG n=1 Tax=Niallia endozanthoxylica TaxID=2036016 RepID=A0A5J5HTZ0_9BACI|nr:cytochrome c oxidase assembly factor CtaG [Niallia endozanthoxylica]KAA9025999.1 cytochrome c oxidase assembly factor CtaG [Niallia endozanthoxylica]
MSLDIFGFRALWSPIFLIFVILITASYFLLTTKYTHVFKNSKPLTQSQIILFGFAMVLIYIVKGSPLDLMGHLMFYAHMIQMSVLLFIIPPILILAVPVWLWKDIWSIPVLKTIMAFFTRPIIALVLFNVTFSLYHIPFIFDVIKTTMWLHEAYTSLLFMLAFSMWWPLVNKLDKNRSIVGLKKVAYIFASGALILPACALIIFNDSPMYAAYSDPKLWAQALALCVPQATLASLDLSGPEMFTSLSLIHDQQLGGILMKIIQEIVYGIVLARVFFDWYRKEQEETEAEQLKAYHPQPVE